MQHILHARDKSYNIGVLQASEAGEHGYRKIGFKEYCRFNVDFSFQCLEECIDFETFISWDESAQQLDLLEPIKLK